MYPVPSLSSLSLHCVQDLPVGTFTRGDPRSLLSRVLIGGRRRKSYEKRTIVSGKSKLNTFAGFVWIAWSAWIHGSKEGSTGGTASLSNGGHSCQVKIPRRQDFLVDCPKKAIVLTAGGPGNHSFLQSSIDNPEYAMFLFSFAFSVRVCFWDQFPEASLGVEPPLADTRDPLWIHWDPRGPARTKVTHLCVIKVLMIRSCLRLI